MNTYRKINLRWVSHQLPALLKVKLVCFALASAFQQLLSGLVLGQLVELDFSDNLKLAEFIFFAVGSFAITAVAEYYFVKAGQRAIRLLNQALKKDYFDDALSKSLSESSEVSDVINRVDGVAKQVEQSYFESLLTVLQSSITLIGSVIVLLKLNFVLSLIYLLFSLISLLPSAFGRNKLTRQTEKWTHANADLMLIIKDLFRGRFDIINFGAGPAFYARFNNKLNLEEAEYERMNTYQYWIQFVSWSFAIFAYLSPIFIGIIFLRNGWFGVTKGIIVTLTLTADSVISGIRQLTQIQTKIVSTEKLRRVPIVKNVFLTPNAKESQPAAKEPKTLAINNLSVQRDQHVIFNHLNLTLAPGEKIIVTGPSGIGKSTLLKTITGRIKPTNGSIRFQGRPITTGDFVLVSQDVWLFNATLRENITLYQNYSDETLHHIFNLVGLDRELGSNALETHIRDNGSNLSGGQAQRIAIARGLLRQSPIFLFDEISANLDDANAYKIRKLMYSLPSIVIEVAHHYDSALAKENGIHVKKNLLGASLTS